MSLTLSVLVSTFLFQVAVPVAAVEQKIEAGKNISSEYGDIITADLNKRTKLVGTFDLYDEASKKVLNLRMVSVEQGAVEKKGDEMVVPVVFRNVATGDMVTLDAQIVKEKGEWAVSDWVIKEIKPVEKNVEKKESFSDEEIRQVILDYIEQQSKFTEHLELFDTNKEIMRKLEFVSLDNKVRKFGILNIVTATFTDLDNGANVTVDVRVKNKEGVLEVDSTKIQKAKKIN